MAEEKQLDKLDHLHELIKLLIKRQEQQDKALSNLSVLILAMGEAREKHEKMICFSILSVIFEFFTAAKLIDDCGIEGDEDNPTPSMLKDALNENKELFMNEYKEMADKISNIRKYIKKNLQVERFHANPIDKDPEEIKEFKVELTT